MTTLSMMKAVNVIKCEGVLSFCGVNTLDYMLHMLSYLRFHMA